jgi:hypothetical protein
MQRVADSVSGVLQIPVEESNFDKVSLTSVRKRILSSRMSGRKIFNKDGGFVGGRKFPRTGAYLCK